MKSASTIAELFAAVLEQKESARSEFLKSKCQNDETLYAEIRQLLEEYENAEADEFLSIPAFEIAAGQLAELEESDSRIGQIFGHYKILKRIGAGGMGAIYLARREDDFEKQVAIKIIKRGMDSEAILMRFHHERQILANLEHPFIARLLDAGTTADGLPYFVMEYVEGLSVDEYCKRNNLPEAERLELFRKICQAISFAHQKLIVHRDLKPSNILVNQNREPKLLDFGIAKLLDETDEATQTEARVLTPAYASPEQKRGEIVGTTSDVYSLGLILAEMLEVEYLRFKIQDSNLKSISHSKAEDRGPKNENLNFDLRNILAKSLREETERRYSSVEKFSEDVRRYLSNLPITARPDTFAYRASKFVERNKIGAVIGLAVVLILTAAVAGIIWQARRAEIERELAERRAENLRKLSNSFAVELHNAILNLPGSLPARQLLLTRAVEQLDSLDAESGNKPEIQDDLAQGYYNLGLLPNENLAQVEQNFQKGTAIYQKLLENEPQNARFQQQLAKGYCELANVQKVRGDLNGSLNYLQKSFSLLQTNAEYKPEDAQRLRLLYETQNDISANLLSMGKANESLEVSRQAFALGEKLEKLNVADDDFERMLYTLHYGICKNLIYLGDYATASEQLQDDLNIILQQASKHPNDTRYQYEIWAYDRTLSLAVEQTGDKNSALQKLESALNIIENLRRISPEDAGYQRNSSYTYFSLGQLFVHQNQPEKALPYFRHALEMSEKIFNADSEKGETREDLARIYSNLGNDLITLGKRQEGIDYLRKSLGFYENTTVNDNQNSGLKSDFAKALAWLGDAIMKSDKAENLKEAQEFEARSLAIWQDLRSKNLLSATDANQFKTSKEMLAQK